MEKVSQGDYKYVVSILLLKLTYSYRVGTFFLSISSSLKLISLEVRKTTCRTLSRKMVPSK